MRRKKEKSGTDGKNHKNCRKIGSGAQGEEDRRVTAAVGIARERVCRALFASLLGLEQKKIRMGENTKIYKKEAKYVKEAKETNKKAKSRVARKVVVEVFLCRVPSGCGAPTGHQCGLSW